MPFVEAATGYADAGHFNNDIFTDAESIATGKLRKVDARSGKILSNSTGENIDPFADELIDQFLAKETNRPVPAAVVFAIFLPVAIDSIEGDAGRRNRLLGHAAGRDIELDQFTGHFNLARL